MSPPLCIAQETVDAVATRLWEIESGLDRLVVQAGELASLTAQARLASNISATVGHRQITAHLPDLLSGLIAAQGSAVELHGGLAAFARLRGLTTMSPPSEKEQSSSTFVPQIVNVAEARAA